MDPSFLATKQDIQMILDVLEELKGLLNKNDKILEQKFLRSYQVRDMLSVSNSTLQRMRISGAIPHKKINGTFFYPLSDIKKLITTQKLKDESILPKFS